MKLPPPGSRCVVCAIGLLIHVPASAAIIDDLTTGLQEVSVDPASPFASSTVAAPGAIGGTRRLTATLTSPTGSGDACIVPGLAIGGSSPSGSMLFGIEWDGGGLGLGDLTGGGLTDCIALEFFSIDPGSVASSMEFRFEFNSTGLGSATITRSIGSGFDPLVPLDFAFSDAVFSPGADSQVFGSVDSLRLSTTVGQAGDFGIRTIRTDSVPEGSPPANVPDGGSTGVLLGAVALVGGILRRLVSRSAG